MSPLEIRILLHYHWSPIDYHQAEDDEHARSPAVASTLLLFVQSGLLKSRYGDLDWAVSVAPFNDTYPGHTAVERPIFSITDKGNAMVEHLCAVQIPVCKWVQPETPT